MSNKKKKRLKFVLPNTFERKVKFATGILVALIAVLLEVQFTDSLWEHLVAYFALSSSYLWLWDSMTEYRD